MKKNWKKVSQCRKKLKGMTLWDFSTSTLLQNSKKIEGGTLWWKKNFERKSHSAEKNLKGGPFGLVRYCMLRGKPFLVQGTFWRLLKILLEFW